MISKYENNITVISIINHDQISYCKPNPEMGNADYIMLQNKSFKNPHEKISYSSHYIH